MPVLVACLVPVAPLLLPRLTGDRVPEVGPVRAAVTGALTSLTGTDRVVVVAARVPGTLAGFGAPQPLVARVEGRSGSARGQSSGSWPHDLAEEILDAAGVGGARELATWDDLSTLDDLAGLGGPTGGGGRTGLLLLADGSRTRGPRAPGGEDPRGAAVDAELVAALREGRAPDVPDAGAVGATAGPAVALLGALAGHRAGAVELLHEAAPLGACYLVAVWRPVRP